MIECYGVSMKFYTCKIFEAKLKASGSFSEIIWWPWGSSSCKFRVQRVLDVLAMLSFQHREYVFYAIVSNTEEIQTLGRIITPVTLTRNVLLPQRERRYLQQFPFGSLRLLEGINGKVSGIIHFFCNSTTCRR